MKAFLLALLVFSLCAGEAAGDTIYKYRRADGRMVYSNQPLAEGVLVETFEYRFPEPAQARTEPDKEKQRLEAEERIRTHLSALEQAWQELEQAKLALVQAEERLRKGAELRDDEARQLAGPAQPTPPAAGGPQPPAPPATGGPGKPAPPAVSGPLGTRQSGGGRSPEYATRMQALEADVAAAREKMEAAQRRYNALR